MEEIIFLDNGVLSIDVDAIFTFTKCKGENNCKEYKVKAINLSAAEIELLKTEYIRRVEL